MLVCFPVAATLLLVKVALLVVEVALTVCLPVAAILLVVKVALLVKARKVKANSKQKRTTNK